MAPRRTAQALALLLPLGLMAGALYSQYVGGLFPCEMCMWQRYPHYAAIILAALSFAAKPGRDVLVWLATLAIAISGAIGAFHAGVEYGWWEGLTRCATNFGSGNALDAIMNAPLVRCDVAPWHFLGISLAGWNAILSLGGALVIAMLMLRKQKRRAFA
ncbi:disulfide bond formation protein B [Sphingomonas sp. BT-65]|uniref:disulfide bond formation protein B n=1 Tax=Sphingomonas sp. BT-65 TaxID=2989821 RepID=UPI0022363CB2|nr:disulfide bond formation protein B [Sphingomonas sp. BT-65]MCW4462129.1 disulfide bond formation protein B [Sphingomonas sp. BT-65]